MNEALGNKSKRIKEKDDADYLMHKKSFKGLIIRYSILICGFAFVIWIVYWSLSLLVQFRYFKKENANLYKKLIYVQEGNNKMLNQYKELNAKIEEIETKNALKTHHLEQLKIKQENTKIKTNNIIAKIKPIEMELIHLDETNENFRSKNIIKEREIKEIESNIAKYELKIKEIKNKIDEVSSADR